MPKLRVHHFAVSIDGYAAGQCCPRTFRANSADQYMNSFVGMGC